MKKGSKNSWGYQAACLATPFPISPLREPTGSKWHKAQAPLRSLGSGAVENTKYEKMLETMTIFSPQAKTLTTKCRQMYHKFSYNFPAMSLRAGETAA